MISVATQLLSPCPRPRPQSVCASPSSWPSPAGAAQACPLSYFPSQRGFNWEVWRYLPAGTDQGGLQHVSGAPGGLGLPHQVGGGTGAAARPGGPDLTGGSTFGSSVRGRSSQSRCDVHAERAAHRDPLAGLQAELDGELEDDGGAGAPLPLQLPAPQVLVLMVRHQVTLLWDQSQTPGPAGPCAASPRRPCCSAGRTSPPGPPRPR